MRIITISGASGSGKSTLAEYILNIMTGSKLLSVDRYYLSKNEQVEKFGSFNFDDPNAIEHELLHDHLDQLKLAGETNVPIYDFTISERAGYEPFKVGKTLIMDGLFAGTLLSERSDFNIFVDANLDTALDRRIERDMRERGRTRESVIEQYERDVRPAYFKHIEPLKANADLVIENNGDIQEMLDAINTQDAFREHSHK
ncbi:uridine kinase family protein [Pseudemcibacter aquimaris]|uniref:uridine kinase family protein n=1 Tax=Pseudemcibacter aquimaris TaxID=2857064 RepID=UPI002011342B|nr:AAA family ATPase [Pseudemcibacter aquimaris]MCC3862564.1 AAA family ATPase [Pseudemcibacter aquimaris]WDU57918.1 AAA family ATPase [Pseudemcibacter aquimaris]